TMLFYDVNSDGYNDLYTYYNTTNWQYEDQTFELQPVFDVPPARNIRGWGRGCIYNQPYEGGYLFPDWNGADGYLGAKDSTEVTQPGETYFLFNPNYACDYGILVGKNPYSNSVFGDVAGGLGNFRGITDYPLDIRYRFNTYISDTAGFSNEDGTYRLDWDAFVNHNGAVRNPKVSLYNETTGTELGKNLLDPNNYDLIYGQANFIRVKLAPNSSPDFPMIPGTLLRVGDFFPETKAENVVEAKTWIENHAENMTVDGKVETVLKITPPGSWKDIVGMLFIAPDLNNTLSVYTFDLARFDVVKTIDIQVKTSRQLRVNQTDTVTIYVREIGTEKPLSGADVRIQGPGINEKGDTDADGKVSFSVTPNAAGVVTITADHDLGEDTHVIVVLDEEKNASVTLNISPVESETTQTEIEIIGQTDKTNRITINSEVASVKSDGFFSKFVPLEEGMNMIQIVATSDNGKETQRIVKVRCDTTVDFTIDPLPDVVEDRQCALSGTLEKAATITVQGQNLEVQDGKWKTILSLDFGKNNVTIEANDELGNKAKKDVEVTVYRKMEVKLTIGSTKMYINGTPADKPLSAPPYISNERTFVPIRVISEAFGADVTWYPETKGIVIEFMERKIEMQVGSKEAFINGKKVILTNAPEIKNGSTFVPLRFVTESLDAAIGWNPDAREITITLYAY
ncbi:MAG: stalk domain-containing protein, partial [Prolixibacteraceae bacterium]|nr:stalk domain-containing protein [Prolixibacteraceae bacterium]